MLFLMWYVSHKSSDSRLCAVIICSVVRVHPYYEYDAIDARRATQPFSWGIFYRLGVRFCTTLVVAPNIWPCTPRVGVRQPAAAGCRMRSYCNYVRNWRLHIIGDCVIHSNVQNMFWRYLIVIFKRKNIFRTKYSRIEPRPRQRATTERIWVGATYRQSNCLMGLIKFIAFTIDMF